MKFLHIAGHMKLNAQQLLFPIRAPSLHRFLPHLENIVPDDKNPHSAREAAEALFKPQKHTPESAAQDAQGNAPTTVDHQPAHEPRILPIQQPQPESEPVQPTESKSGKKRGRPPALKGSCIPKSEYGRIRALATYGMTVAQVAGVYGVAESEVDRVVGPKV
jgi:hypothetical protein